MRRRRAVLSCALTAFAVAGCAPPSSNDVQNESAAIQTLLDSCAKGDPVAIQETLTEPARSTFSRQRSTVAGCQTATGLALGRGDFARVGVKITRTHGVYAQARLTAPDGTQRFVELDDVGGDWQVAGTLR